ncbi:unnamed protein product [Heligmosomoides polygyrus]|uniref:Uncharacterized protein n=1 Tax=Heligmosomoides polygyrus TaxID=6339 RepID=A0A3P7Y5I1_HELPZ|nr:unnamed protein product [Heligmosomoides polygyrus]
MHLQVLGIANYEARLSVDGLYVFTIDNNDDIPKGELKLSGNYRYGQMSCIV